MSVKIQIELAHAKKTMGELDKKKKQAISGLSNTKKKYEAVVSHIRFLKSGSEVVLLSEYQTMINQRNDLSGDIRLWESALAKYDEGIKLLQERLRMLELASQESETPDEPEETLAKVLEFKLVRKE